MLDNNDKNDNVEEIDDDVSYGRENKDEMNKDGLSYDASFRKEEKMEIILMRQTPLFALKIPKTA